MYGLEKQFRITFKKAEKFKGETGIKYAFTQLEARLGIMLHTD